MSQGQVLNEQIEEFHKNLSVKHREFWYRRGITDNVLDLCRIGYDPKTKYYIFPYYDEDGECHAFKAINVDKEEFWYPAGVECLRIFNIQDIAKAIETKATLYIAEGEKDCLVLKMNGYLCIGISGTNGFREDYVALFKDLKDIVVCYDNDPPGQTGGKRVVELLGKKARSLVWPEGFKKDINDLYLLGKENFKTRFEELVKASISHAEPFLVSSADRFNDILSQCKRMAENKLIGIPTGYPRLDSFIDGVRGITILGGQPKIGKSTLALRIAANASINGYPTVYMDFENGPYRLIMKILNRISQIDMRALMCRMVKSQALAEFPQIKEQFNAIGQNLFIHRPSRRDIIEEGDDFRDAASFLFERYVSFIREDLKMDKDIFIVIDSLQKLPLWSMSDRRGGIDSWLRSFEVARDKHNVSFLIISELARGGYESASIDSFKESGDIEYTADLAIQMKQGKDTSGNDIIELHAVGNRNGETGLISGYKPNYELSDFEELPSIPVMKILKEIKKNGK